MKIFKILFFIISMFPGLSYSQVFIKQNDFKSKNVLAQLFDGEFQKNFEVQKWLVPNTQALEMISYLDVNQNAFTIIDTIISSQKFNLQLFAV